MAEQVTALIKFQHCDFAEEFAKAMAAYDADPQTAWLAPFTVAQKDYWAIQAVAWLPLDLLNAGLTLAGSRLFNKFADDLAAQRNTAIYNAASNAFNSCIAGGAASPAPVIEPGFRLSLHSRLDGGNASGAAPSDSGLSTQLQVPFAPANPAGSDSPLDWRPFYRLGPVTALANDPQNWTMAFTGADPYSAPLYATTPMRSTITVTPGWLTSIGGLFEPCIPYPTDRVVAAPDSLAASFEAIRSELLFTVCRHVLMPDGALTSAAVEVGFAESGAWQAGRNFEVMFPGFSSPCEQSGTVIVRHQIQAFAIYSEFALNSDIEKLRDDVGGVHDRPTFIASQGSLTQMAGNFPDAYRYVEESFYYLAINIGVVKANFFNDVGVFQYQRMFIVWRGTPAADAALVGLTSNAMPAKYYGKYLTPSTLPEESIHLYPVPGSSATLDVWLTLPLVDTVTIQNLGSDTLSVSGTYNYVVEDGPFIKIKNVLKPLDEFTPYGPFAIPQPTYESTGHFLSVLPDFIEFMTIALGIVRVKYKQAGVFQYQKMFLVWNGTPISQDYLADMTSNATATKFYGTHLAETSASTELITVTGGAMPVGTYRVPVIDDVVVNNINAGTLSVSASPYIVYSDHVIKVRNTLKPLHVFTPYGPFVEAQPGYQATGNFLSVLPDFIDSTLFREMFKIIRVIDTGLYNNPPHPLQIVYIFLTWADVPVDLSGYGITAVAFPDFPSPLYRVPAESFPDAYLVRLYNPASLAEFYVPVVGEAILTQGQFSSSDTDHIYAFTPGPPWLGGAVTTASGLLALNRPYLNYRVTPASWPNAAGSITYGVFDVVEDFCDKKVSGGGYDTNYFRGTRVFRG